MEWIAQNWEVFSAALIAVLDVVFASIDNSKVKYKGIILRLISILGDASKAAVDHDSGSNKGQSGSVSLSFVFALILACMLFFGLVGCAGHKTATQQVMEKSKNPVDIARAMVLDAENNYDLALDVYVQYRPLWEANNPGLVKDLDKKFVDASKMLDEWHRYAAIGMVDKLDTTTFKAFRRSILLIVAEIEGVEVPR